MRDLLITQSCLTLCDPTDCSSPGSSVHGIPQAGGLEWVAISFSRGSSHVLHGRQILYHWATWIALYTCVVAVQSFGHVQLFATPWTAARQASLSFTTSRNLLKLMSIESAMPSNHHIFCRPLLLPWIFPSIRVFSKSQFFASSGQQIGVSASTSVLPMITQAWSPLGWTGWISLQSKGLSRVFSNISVQKHQFFGAQLSLYSNSHIHTWLLEKP